MRVGGEWLQKGPGRGETSTGQRGGGPIIRPGLGLSAGCSDQFVILNNLGSYFFLSCQKYFTVSKFKIGFFRCLYVKQI